MDKYYHRRTKTLDVTKAPSNATHVATITNGFKYFVRFNEGTCWICGSDQYGEAYNCVSLYQKDVAFEELPAKQESLNDLPAKIV